MLEKFFHLSANHTTVRTELLGGTTTFFTLSYSLFVQPALLSSIGMDFGSVFVATCLASAFATLLMGLYANFPIALAPAMGHNFFFVFSVCGAISAGGMGLPWETALGGVFIAGLLFLIVSRAGMRGRLLQVIPSTLTHAIPIGIGLLIAFIGFQWSGIIVAKPGVLLGIGSLTNPPVLLSILGLLITGLLLARGNKAAILIGLVATTTIGMVFGMVSYSGWISVPPSLEPTLLKLNFSGLLSRSGIIIISMFFFLALFD
ncbi:MAG: NCS2 family permease, partial [Nitrospirota bacterium]|nr:NCS2 family permease [Nitrospirota bacterium]